MHMQTHSFPLVAIDESGELRASSEVIAKGVGVRHKNMLELIRRYQTELGLFGLLAFETRPRAAGKHGGGDVEFAMLNEHQTTLILTFMRNSEKVIKFKVQLVAEFYRMQEALRNRDLTLWQKRHALEIRDAESKVRASFGSALMLERKRELPELDAERYQLDTAMNPPLFLN